MNRCGGQERPLNDLLNLHYNECISLETQAQVFATYASVGDQVDSSLTTATLEEATAQH